MGLIEGVLRASILWPSVAVFFISACEAVVEFDGRRGKEGGGGEEGEGGEGEEEHQEEEEVF